MRSIVARLTARSPALRVFADRANDYLILTKPRIASFVFISAFVAALLGLGLPSNPGPGLEIALFVTLVAGAGCAFNMLLERDLDRLMHRTRTRPTVEGRLSVTAVVAFGSTLAILGTLGLWLRFNLAASALALATLFTYVVIYTPLKRATSLNTLVGAIPGAAPPLIAYVAATGGVGSWGATLFAIIFVWQFPHFFAIAYLHREDYARAGMKMLPALPNAEGASGRQAALYSIVLIPVSLLPILWSEAGLVFTVGALVMGFAYCACSFAFAWREDEKRARALLICSLFYLPLMHGLVLLDPVARAAAAG